MTSNINLDTKINLDLNMSGVLMKRATGALEPHKMNMIGSKTEEVTQIRQKLVKLHEVMATLESRLGNDGDIDLSDKSDLINEVRNFLSENGKAIFPDDRFAWSKEEVEGKLKTLGNEAHYLTQSIPIATTAAQQEWEELRLIMDIVSRAMQREDRLKDEIIRRSAGR